jgi:hypothetical protein
MAVAFLEHIISVWPQKKRGFLKQKIRLSLQKFMAFFPTISLQVKKFSLNLDQKCNAF